MCLPNCPLSPPDELNEHLLKMDDDKHTECDTDSIDAFGISFQAIEEPMPTVKLAGGFDVTLRTMFKEQRCQTSYGRIDNASLSDFSANAYPASIGSRMDRRLETEEHNMGKY